MVLAERRPGLGANVAEYVARPRPMLIDGIWVQAESGETFPIFDPATEEEVAQVAWGEKADVDKDVRAARRAFDGPWRKSVTPSERGRMIWKLADLLDQNAEEFAQLEALDNGKPVTVARAADVPLAIDLLR